MKRCDWFKLPLLEPASLGLFHVCTDMSVCQLAKLLDICLQVEAVVLLFRREMQVSSVPRVARLIRVGVFLLQ